MNNNHHLQLMMFPWFRETAFLACRACKTWLMNKNELVLCVYGTVHALLTNISLCQIKWEKCVIKWVYINDNIIFAAFFKLKTFFKLLILQQRRRKLINFFKCSCTAACWTEVSPKRLNWRTKWSCLFLGILITQTLWIPVKLLCFLQSFTSITQKYFCLLFGWNLCGASLCDIQ